MVGRHTLLTNKQISWLHETPLGLMPCLLCCNPLDSCDTLSCSIPHTSYPAIVYLLTLQFFLHFVIDEKPLTYSASHVFPKCQIIKSRYLEEGGHRNPILVMTNFKGIRLNIILYWEVPGLCSVPPQLMWDNPGTSGNPTNKTKRKNSICDIPRCTKGIR